MVNRYVWIGIATGLFFAGLGVGYLVFVNTYNPASLMFQNPAMFNQMISRNPQYMGQWMQYAIQDPSSRNQMYGYMLQSQPFMQGMMQNSQFQQQYMKQYQSNPQGNYQPSNPPSSGGTTSNQGFQMGPGMMGNSYQGYRYGQGMINSGYNQTFRTISIKDAESASQLPTYAQISKESNTITFNSQKVDLVPLPFGGEEARNFTGTSVPTYAKDDVFVIGNMIDPTLVFKVGTQLNVTAINMDEDMGHNFVIMSSSPPYPYMPMQNMMSGGVIAIMPVIPNDDPKGGYAYETGYQITLTQPGTYWYLCSYPGHAEEGMYGKITVP